MGPSFSERKIVASTEAGFQCPNSKPLASGANDVYGNAGMSVSAFHHNFKEITATSPRQYLKTIRPHKARMLMVQEGLAADRVGYESTSQFSREFKSFFGATPLDEVAQIRVMLGLDSSNSPAYAVPR